MSVAAYLRSVLGRIWDDIRHNFTALLAIVCYMALAWRLFGTVCPGLMLTGKPCPACGLTRAGILLLSGRFAAAFRMNPAIYIWAPLLLYLCAVRYGLGKKPRAALLLGAAAGIATIVIYVCRFRDILPILQVFSCVTHITVL